MSGSSLTPYCRPLQASLLGGAAYRNRAAKQETKLALVSLSHLKQGNLQEGQEAGGTLRLEA